jgi:hypothetical protein
VGFFTRWFGGGTPLPPLIPNSEERGYDCSFRVEQDGVVTGGGHALRAAATHAGTRVAVEAALEPAALRVARHRAAPAGWC